MIHDNNDTDIVFFTLIFSCASINSKLYYLYSGIILPYSLYNLTVYAVSTVLQLFACRRSGSGVGKVRIGQCYTEVRERE